MNYTLTETQTQQISCETSRRLHERLALFDEQLRQLEAEPTALTVADYNRRFLAIVRLRAQTREAIEALREKEATR